MIEQIGAELFYSNPNFEELREIEPPVCFYFVYGAFIEIKNHCYKVMTLRDIRAYEELHNCKLTEYEIEVIMKCNNWAEHKISELEMDQE